MPLKFISPKPLTLQGKFGRSKQEETNMPKKTLKKRVYPIASKTEVQYRVPDTLGNQEIVRAMDSKLDSSGFYGLIRHSMEEGTLPCQGKVPDGIQLRY